MNKQANTVDALVRSILDQVRDERLCVLTLKKTDLHKRIKACSDRDTLIDGCGGFDTLSALDDVFTSQSLHDEYGFGVSIALNFNDEVLFISDHEDEDEMEAFYNSED